MRLPRLAVSAFLSLIVAGLVPALAAAQPASPAPPAATEKAASPRVSPTPPATPPGTAPAKAPESAPAAPKTEPAPEPTKRPPSPPSSNVPQHAAFAVKLGPPIAVSAIRKVASVEGITEYRLPNGLKVLLFPDASKPTITVNITYQVGSRFENYGETGMAHLLEHLMFKGTPKHPHIDQEFNARGVRFNGTTWLDRTNYYDIFQASDDNLAWAIGLEADRMVSSFISRQDLSSEMTVVRNEYEEGENSPFSVLLKRMQSVAYDWHAYGRSTIGNRSDIENVDIPHLQAFYNLYYQPDNAVLLIAGKFDEKKALALVAKSFGPLPKPTRARPVFWTVEPTQDGNREFTVRRKGDIQVVAMAYHVPSNLHPDSDALGFAGFILGQVPTGRLHKELVEKGLASQVFAYPLMGHDPGIQIFGAVVKKGDAVEPVRDAMAKIVESFGATPPTKEEMERARISMENDVEKTIANPEALGVQLSEYIALGDWRLFFLARDRLAEVKAEDVARVSTAYFRRDNRTVGLFLPEDNPQRAEVPATPTVAEVMKDFKAKAGETGAEAFDPSQANIDARTRRLSIGPLKVALLSKKNRGQTVNVALSLHIGNEKALFGQQANAAFAGRMLSRGTTRLTRAELSDALERLKVSGRVGGPSASFQTTRPNLEGALKLVAEVLKEPRFDPAEFEQLRTQTVTGIQSQLSEPEARAGDELAKVFNTYPKGDWRYNPSLEESLEDAKAVKLEDAKRFHDRFYGADPADIAIVGDFDPAQVEAELKALFAGWEPKVPFAQVTREFRDIPAVVRSVETPDKENAVLIARENVQMRDDDPDYPALYVADYILGGGAGFDSRLASRIRQKEGLSYGVGSQLEVGSIDRAGAWSAYAIAAPQNVAKVETALREELSRALKDGFTQAELDAAKSGILQIRAQNRSQDRALAAAWAGNLYLGRTFQFSSDFEAKVKALGVADVNAALRKHIDPAKVTIVKAGDFTKK
ncbi:MAG TPA: pitrilysin family protein [Usitatibacter sp.]|nr:pitrilysin family protein [Usitatibacter sp.]